MRTARDRTAALVAKLEGVLDANALISGAAVSEGYRGDATVERGAPPAIVFRPADTRDVTAILSACNDVGQPIVIQGGRTGLSGGARPRPGEVSLSLERMRGVGAVDTAAGTIMAEAGATLQAVQDEAADHDLMFGVDIGARGTATIGGNISTNAGGIRVLRYGMYRAQVLGLEAVLADGSVLSNLKSLAKDNSGYDLKHLFIGTEGTLGVVTRACLRLHPMPRAQAAAFCALPSLSAAIDLLRTLRGKLGSLLSAFEVIFPDVYAGAIARSGATPPVPSQAGMYALVEIQGPWETEDETRFTEALMAAFEDGIVSDVAVSASMRDHSAIWALREGASAFVFGLTDMVGFDVGLPISALQRFLDMASRDVLVADPDAQFYIFGHLGDGNLHYIVRTRHQERVADAVFAAVARCGGTISAEHGIGLDKKRWLPLVRTPAELAAMRRLKAALDPGNILNPGRVFDVTTATSEGV